MKSDAKKILKISSLIVLFLCVAIYAFFTSRDLIFGVKIKNVNVETLLQESNMQTLRGNAKNAVKLSLNGREISIDQAGNWEETIVLHPGYNIISVVAVDKFGNVDEKNYQVMRTVN